MQSSSVSRDNRHPAPARAVSQRPVGRPPPPAAAPSRSQGQTPVEVGRLSPPLPKGRPVTRALRCAFCSNSAIRTAVRTAGVEGPRKTFAAAIEAGRRQSVKIQPFVVELFARTARFSAAASRKGSFVMSFHWGCGPLYDLGRKDVQALILGWIRAGLVLFLLAG